MKIVMSFIASFSLYALAADPAMDPAIMPTSPGQEKVEQIQQSGGALKIEKKPAEIEGLTPPKDETKKKKGQKAKKQKASEEVPVEATEKK